MLADDATYAGDSALLGELLQRIREGLCVAAGVVHAEVVDLRSNCVTESFKSVYFTSLVWEELLSVVDREPDLARLKRSAMEYLRSSGSAHVGWSFFPERRGYPADVDDTAVVAHALRSCGGLSDCDAVVGVLERNRRADGSYYVWCEGAGRRHRETSDGIVDANVARFMRSVRGESYAIPASVMQALERFPWDCTSVYSCRPEVCSWFVSRLDRDTNRVHNDGGLRARAERLEQKMEPGIEFPGLVASIMATYGRVERARYYAARAAGSEARGWLFRHTRSQIGYSCGLLDIAGACRAASLLGAGEERWATRE